MPDKVIQYGQLNRHRGREKITEAMRRLSEEKKRARL
jgi:hypothetical protein